MLRLRFVRHLNYYTKFPKTFPQGCTEFHINPRKLRREFVELQNSAHPDLNPGEHDLSAELNTAYNTLKQPLLRAQHILKEFHGIDLTKESIEQSADPATLLEVLELHEALEDAGEAEISGLKEENDERILESESVLQKALFDEIDLSAAVKETIKLKYWDNLGKAIKNWEPGKPISLTH